MSLVHGSCAFIIVFLVAACDQSKEAVTPADNASKPIMERVFFELTPPDRPNVASFRRTEEPPGTYGGFFIDPKAVPGTCPVRYFESTSLGAKAYRGEGGQIVPFAFSFPPQGQPAMVLDLNGDGILDVITMRQHVVWFGTSGGEYRHGLDLPHSDGAAAYPYDINGDGLLDLVAVRGFDCVRPFHIFYQTRDGAFVDDEEAVTGETSCNTGYVSWAGRLAGELVVAAMGSTGHGSSDPRPGLFCKQGQASRGNPQFAPCLWEPRMHNGHDDYRGIKLWFLGGVNQGDTASPVIDFVGEPQDWINGHAPMGFTVADINGDGRLDFSAMTDSLLATFLETPTGWRDITGEIGFPLAKAHTKGVPIPWGAMFVDVDGDGRPDLVVANGNDWDEWVRLDLNAVGEQPVELYLNQGGRFANASFASGLGNLGQWKSLAVGDLFCTGKPCVVFGGQGRSPLYFQNRRVAQGLSIALRGSASNPLGIGARIVVEVAGMQPQYVLVGSTGGSVGFTHPMAFAGLGTASKASKVTLTWPSGNTQVMDDVLAGFHLFEEER